MLKRETQFVAVVVLDQPPSGGCVLKHRRFNSKYLFVGPAAFRRLCVETGCVAAANPVNVPAAFRRLCVETKVTRIRNSLIWSSRLQAAVC